MSKPTIAAIIITKNEEKMLANCLETLAWCNEVIVIDNSSDDRTSSIAEQLKAKVYEKVTTSFAESRNFGFEKARNFDWVFYIDADERVSPTLAKEILVQIETTGADALKMHRENMMYGKIFKHGGWEDDYQTRVFKVSTFGGWFGDIHESPKLTSEPILLHSSLLHLTHRNTIDGLKKTISWTPIEARLLYEGKTPAVKKSTLIRKGMMEVIRRYFLKGGSQDGMEGWIESVVQGINRILVYIQLWEMQQTPTLEEKYLLEEKELLQLWKKEK